MNLQTRLFPWSVLLIIILAVLLFFTWRESGNKENTYSESLKLQEKSFQTQIATEKARVLAERHERQASDSIHRMEKGRLTSDLNASKRKERRLRVDTVTMTLTDTIFAQYDTIILRTEAQRKEDSLSFEREIKILTGTTLKLDSANTAKLNFMIEQSDIIQKQDKKITKLEKWLKGLGIYGVVVTVVTVLLIL